MIISAIRDWPLEPTGSVPKTGNINLVSNVFLGSKETARYTLIIWWNMIVLK